ncbi:MAG TPA: iron-containing alcohol dehydrogenase [Chryseolinea sp.]
MMGSLNLAGIPQLHFGPGKVSVLSSILKTYGQRVLLVTGANSFLSSKYGSGLVEELQNGFDLVRYSVSMEPTPSIIDEAVGKFAPFQCDVVVAIGGGSVLDSGKAISAMLPLNEPVKDYLEGVGTKPRHPGVKIPFIAVPTTSGTGSEATKNAVLSELGEKGYKKSLRHNNFVPDVAILDPALTVSCPQSITASSGMDAFTQLLESYLSTASNIITDALAVEGLGRVSHSLPKAYTDGSDIEARTDMALAAYLSGNTLANAGLGLVHGFASSIGGFFEIPHGVICSALMPACNRLTVKKLRHTHTNDSALFKYATVGKLFSDHIDKSDDYYIDHLLGLLDEWSRFMNIPQLRSGGISSEHFEKIVRATDNKNNPVALGEDEMMEVLEQAT